MGLRLQRVGLECLSVWEAVEDWYDEIVTDNGPRYRDPREWVHLWVDLLGATIQLAGRTVDRLHYTLAHIAGVGLPAYLLWSLVWA